MEEANGVGLYVVVVNACNALGVGPAADRFAQN